MVNVTDVTTKILAIKPNNKLIKNKVFYDFFTAQTADVCAISLLFSCIRHTNFFIIERLEKDANNNNNNSSGGGGGDQGSSSLQSESSKEESSKEGSSPPPPLNERRRRDYEETRIKIHAQCELWIELFIGFVRIMSNVNPSPEACTQLQQAIFQFGDTYLQALRKLDDGTLVNEDRVALRQAQELFLGRAAKWICDQAPHVWPTQSVIMHSLLPPPPPSSSSSSSSSSPSKHIISWPDMIGGQLWTLGHILAAKIYTHHTADDNDDDDDGDDDGNNDDGQRLLEQHFIIVLTNFWLLIGCDLCATHYKNEGLIKIYELLAAGIFDMAEVFILFHEHVSMTATSIVDTVAAAIPIPPELANPFSLLRQPHLLLDIYSKPRLSYIKKLYHTYVSIKN